ncbi:MAG: VirB3 family type IV secretion system protein [Caldilineaceae bacterium]|nr:VirB3 family type IV secretion system protein [Caldilineaceae bacterium]
MRTATPLFVGLTRPVSVAGLPMMYCVVLMAVVVGGFIATLSVIYLGASAVLGYVGLRLLAAHDPRFFDVIIVALRKTPLPPRYYRGRGISYYG